ncbi:hypothetical protein niasHT_024634 [Heterodera trifolii]|uniref:Effector protein n=1 Tax=Heterodera trifolii TaxID=157864 RepID=A0ABD2K7K1_9BILA
MTSFSVISVSFFAFFIAHFSLFYYAKCDGSSSLSDQFTTFILSHTSAHEGTSAGQQNLVKLDMDSVRMLQQMIGQNAIEHIVAEDGTFAGLYTCQLDIQFQFDGFSLADGKFHRLLFSFGAILCAEIGGPAAEQSTEENSKYMRSLLKAFECSGGQLKKAEKNKSEFGTAQWLDPENSIFKSGIVTVMEENLNEQLEVKEIFLKIEESDETSHRQNIGIFIKIPGPDQS